MAAIVTGESVPRSALTPTGGFLRTFTHTFNPYVGCVFGCAYCYVRESPVALRETLPWGRYVRSKTGVDRLLEDELREHERRGTLGLLRIFMSSVTDPYQPIERRLGLTRRCLEAFARRPPQVLVVQTRAPLVTRDIDALAAFSSRVWVSVTVETDDEPVRRALTPACPPIEHRLAAMRELVRAGIRVQAALSPLLPHHPAALAEKLRDACTRAVVDTFVSGDGSGGRRTARCGIPELYARLGYAAWDDEAPARALHASLSAALGPDRVVWSRDGFNAV